VANEKCTGCGRIKNVTHLGSRQYCRECARTPEAQQWARDLMLAATADGGRRP
jgi:hypothetical protein